MKFIQFLVIVLLMCVSTVALAKGGDKDQLLITPPLADGRWHQVIYSNHSGEELRINFEWFDAYGDSVSDGFTDLVNRGVSWIAIDMDALVASNITYAHVSWFGKSDDVMVTVCTLDALSAPTFKVCVRAN